MSALQSLPEAVTVYEVGPRDGLQNESTAVPAEVKIHFIDLLSQSGLPIIEVTSFVRSEAIPQLADAEQVAVGIARTPVTRFVALVPNLRGMERAEAGQLDGIALFAAASETFSRRNTGAGVDETFARFVPVVERARALGLWIRGYVSTAFGCPYEGRVAVEAVASVTGRLVALGVDEVAISDTIGVATPADVATVLDAVSDVVDLSRVALHFHDTRGTALANVLAALQLGIRTFDASAGGLGGCPYAPGATGNLATEDLVYMLDGLHIRTGVSLHGVVEATRYLAEITGLVPASRYFRAAVA
ncbi:MAG TPA: hydroxymethylglutaryl-CoA lyase [Chloroflexota bacterium]